MKTRILRHSSLKEKSRIQGLDYKVLNRKTEIYTKYNVYIKILVHKIKIRSLNYKLRAVVRTT